MAVGRHVLYTCMGFSLLWPPTTFRVCFRVEAPAPAKSCHELLWAADATMPSWQQVTLYLLLRQSQALAEAGDR